MQYHSNVNIQYGDGWTPLYKAVSTQNIYCIELLLNYGADYTIPSLTENTAKDFALLLENQDIVDLIESYEIPIKEPE